MRPTLTRLLPHAVTGQREEESQNLDSRQGTTERGEGGVQSANGVGGGGEEWPVLPQDCVQ